MLKQRKQSNIAPCGNASQKRSIQVFVIIKSIGGGSAGQHQIHHFLRAIPENVRYIIILIVWAPFCVPMSSHERQVVRVHIRSQAAQTSSHHHREENGDYGAGSGIGVESKNCSLHKSLGLVQVFEGERL